MLRVQAAQKVNNKIITYIQLNVFVHRLKSWIKECLNATLKCIKTV